MKKNFDQETINILEKFSEDAANPANSLYLKAVHFIEECSYFSDMEYDYDNPYCQFLLAYYENTDYNSPNFADKFFPKLSNFRYEDLKGRILSTFDKEGSIMIINSDLDEEEENIALLHSLIHYYEDKLNNVSYHYHDILVIALYRSLSRKVEDLDDLIIEYGRIQNIEHMDSDIHDEHDILFLLKSFDLDIKMDLEIGTIYNNGQYIDLYNH